MAVTLPSRFLWSFTITFSPFFLFLLSIIEFQYVKHHVFGPPGALVAVPADIRRLFAGQHCVQGVRDVLVGGMEPFAAYITCDCL